MKLVQCTHLVMRRHHRPSKYETLHLPNRLYGEKGSYMPVIYKILYLKIVWAHENQMRVADWGPYLSIKRACHRIRVCPSMSLSLLNFTEPAVSSADSSGKAVRICFNYLTLCDVQQGRCIGKTTDTLLNSSLFVHMARVVRTHPT
jgi:hypothetical protein